MSEARPAGAAAGPRANDHVAIVSRVRRLASGCVRRVARPLELPAQLGSLLPGKMLRTRLAARFAVAESCPAEREAVLAACAATELAHTASLCHDDVIDNDMMRRACPALWRTAGRSAAVLIGDLLLCEATDLLLEAVEGRLLPPFLEKVRETCSAEAEQELRWRGRRPDAASALRLARQKTGPLFAFVSLVCGGSQQRLSGALESAGYCVGTAYQLADDLLDICGRERAAGKTLGSDSRRGKLTLAHGAAAERSALRRRISELHKEALQHLEPWASLREGLKCFFAEDLRPVLKRFGLHLESCISGTK